MLGCGAESLRAGISPWSRPAGRLAATGHDDCHLRLGGERHGEEAASYHPDERTSVHGVSVWPRYLMSLVK